MKVNQDYNVRTNSYLSEGKVAKKGSTGFRELVHIQNEKIKMNNLQQLFKEVEETGKRLAISRTFRDLAVYKNAIQKFIKEAVSDGLDLHSSISQDLFGQNRTLQTIKKIDEKLIDLTDEVLQKENGNLKILSLIDDIKGLIINLYT